MKFLIPFFLLVFLSCSPKTPKLMQFVPAEKVLKGSVMDTNIPVDILFVIDDSGSMASYQDQLSRNVGVLLSSIAQNSNLDYHIGVMNSSVSDEFTKYADGALQADKTGPRFIDRNTKDGLVLLKRYLKVGVSGSSEEKFFDPIMLGLGSPMGTTGVNKGFIRADAALVIIFLTDADDQSILNKKPKIDLPTENVYDFLVALKGNDAKRVIPYGVIIPEDIPDDECTRSGEDKPYRLQEFIGLFGGYVYSMCDPNFSGNLDFMAKDIAKRVSRVIYLNQIPVVSTISVHYDGELVPNNPKTGWIYDPSRNALLLGPELLDRLSGIKQLEVHYDIIENEL